VAWRIGARERDIVADLALQRDVGDEAAIGLGVEPRHVAGVGIAVRIAVRHVEEENEFVAARKACRFSRH